MAKTINRYSIGFKQKVVSEIEKGKIGIYQARILYGIGGGGTIRTWIKQLGKNHLISKIVRIQMSNEINILKQLQDENKRLKLALAEAVLEKDVLKKTIELAERDGIVLKKSTNGSPLQSSKQSTQLKGSAPTTK